MTLEKAIKNLAFLAREGTQDMEIEDYDAVRLGSEALSLNMSMRETYPHPELLILPSETND